MVFHANEPNDVFLDKIHPKILIGHQTNILSSGGKSLSISEVTRACQQ